MIDSLTKKPLKIIPEEKGGPSLRIAVEQLKDVQKVLDEHKVDYWVPEYAFSFNDGPMKISVYFSSRTDPKKVQKILDVA